MYFRRLLFSFFFVFVFVFVLFFRIEDDSDLYISLINLFISRLILTK